MNSKATTESGIVEGFYEEGIHKFFGIPYAEAPVGNLRWRAPQALKIWPGVRKAKAFGPACSHLVGASFNMRVEANCEDCLYLNIWTKILSASAYQPVMVWIHGGGNLGGAASEDATDGSHLARNGVTTVSFNYRLGAFGYLTHPMIGSNFGLRDQLAALKWVRANIAAFGGDPDNVTVFGQSAGAIGVRALLSCPPASGLFHRAVLQSGGFETPAYADAIDYPRAQAVAEAYFERLDTRDPVELRAKPVEDSNRASQELSGVVPKHGELHTPADLVWMPIADGELLVENSFQGWPQDVPILFGCVENEARYFLDPTVPYDLEKVDTMARLLGGRNYASVRKILDRSGVTTFDALDKLVTTAIWWEPALATLDKFALLGRTAYYFHFKRRSPGSIATQTLTKHTAEIPYIFGNISGDDAYDAVDRSVSNSMHDAWISFARDGVPKSSDGLVWPAYNPINPQIALIDDSVSVVPLFTTDLTASLHFLRLIKCLDLTQ